jgi:hypothetical protein
MSLRRVLRASVNMSILAGKPIIACSSPSRAVPPNPYESTRVNDAARFEDEAAPTEDDMISK